MTALRTQLAASVALLDNSPLLAVRSKVDALRVDYMKAARQSAINNQNEWHSYWTDRARAMADVIRLIDETLMEDET